MFRAHCTAEDTDVLLTTRRITAVHRDGATVTIEFTCWCGHRGHSVDPVVEGTAPHGTSPAPAPLPVPA